MSNLFTELRRRNVFKVGAAYFKAFSSPDPNVRLWLKADSFALTTIPTFRRSNHYYCKGQRIELGPRLRPGLGVWKMVPLGFESHTLPSETQFSLQKKFVKNLLNLNYLAGLFFPTITFLQNKIY